MAVTDELYPPATAEHVMIDLHDLARTLARIEEKIDTMRERVDALEAEFGPLARKWSGRAAALAATPAARFARSRRSDQHE